MVPLIMVQDGEKAVVIRFEGDGAEFKRIRSFGLDINTEITVVTSQAAAGGPMMLAVNGARYAIDYNLASKILVRPL